MTTTTVRSRIHTHTPINGRALPCVCCVLCGGCVVCLDDEQQPMDGMSELEMTSRETGRYGFTYAYTPILINVLPRIYGACVYPCRPGTQRPTKPAPARERIPHTRTQGRRARPTNTQVHTPPHKHTPAHMGVCLHTGRTIPCHGAALC